MKTLTRILTPILLLGIAQHVNAQLVADPNPTPAQVIQDVLLGNGVEAFNITFSGNADQVGTFDCTNCGIGIGSGMMLATGSVTVAQGPNNSGSATIGGGNFGAGDPDLDMLSTFGTNDAAILEFDFIPTGDSISFQYVFGSEEYNEYVCGSVNDAFGFFLSGPGINGPYSNNAINLALVPGTNIPVTINTVNLGISGANGTPANCAQVSPLWNQNAEYYVNNEGNGSPITVQFDGFTVILTAAAEVVCGETYHLKIAIADAGDTAFDSGVFLKENSFSSPQIDVDLSITDLGANDSTIFEGCGTSFLVFTRSDNIPGAQSFDIDVSGFAIPGVDYTALPSTIDFPANVFEVSVPFSAFADGITEGLEWVTITYLSLAECLVDEEFQSETFYIQEPDPLEVILDDVLVDCSGSAVLNPQFSGGYGIYEFEWEDGGNTVPLEVNPLTTTTYNYTLSDTCGVSPFNGSVTVEVQDYPAIIVELGNPIAIGCLDALEITANPEGGNGVYFYEWTDEFGAVIGTNQTLIYDPVAEGNLFLTVTDECGNAGEDGLAYSFDPEPIDVELNGPLQLPCLGETVITAEVSGGIGAYFYTWTGVNDENLGNTASINYTMGEEGTIELTVLDECGNTGSDELVVALIPTPVNVDLGLDLEVTCTDITTLDAIVSGGVGNYTYEWVMDGEVQANSPTFDAQTLVDVSVMLTVSDQCGNTASDEIMLTVPPVPVIVDLGPDLDVTCLEITTLEGTVSGGIGTYSYEWMMNGEVQSEDPTFDAQTEAAVNVMLTITDQCGNTASDQVMLSVPPVPVYVDLGPDQIVNCIDPNELGATVSGGIGTYHYEWYVEGIFESEEDSLSVQVYDEVSLWLIAEDECGNIGVDTLLLSVPEEPILVVTTPDTLICAGEFLTLQASASGGYGGFTYLWMPTMETDSIIEIQPLNSFTYQVIAEDICGNVGQNSTTVVVEYVYANFDFDYEGNWGIETYNGSSPQNASFYWDFGDGTNSTEFDPSHEYNQLYSYDISLTATTLNGCVDSISRTFYPFMDIYIPNSFTPNNDGINDYFKAEGSDIREFELWIYNRWGEQVFNSTDIDVPWLGNHKGGEYYGQNEVYTYRVKAVGIRGNSIEKTGTVTLLR